MIKIRNTFSHEISRFSEEFNLKEKRSIDSNRSSILLESISSNPSSAILLENVMSKIDCSEFDVFELDNLINRKTVFLIANEIFERFQLLDLVDEKKFKEFITQIVSGYKREVTYHNVSNYLLRTFMLETCYKQCLYYSSTVILSKYI